MKNWQFIVAIFILILLICIKVKESLENSGIVYDINNTINYNESNYNVMNRGMIEKNKTVIKEENDLVQENKQLTIDIPECNNDVIQKTNYYHTVALPALNNAANELTETIYKIILLKNQYNSGVRTSKTLDNTINIYNTTINNVQKARDECNVKYQNKLNLPTGHYSIKSVKTGKYCTDGPEGVCCDATQLQGWEKFYIINIGGGYYNIRGGRNNQFCADDHNPIVIKCNRNDAREWEVFRIHYKKYDKNNNIYEIAGGRGGKLCSNTGRITCLRDNFLRDEEFIIEPWPGTNATTVQPATTVQNPFTNSFGKGPGEKRRGGGRKGGCTLS